MTTIRGAARPRTLPLSRAAGFAVVALLGLVALWATGAVVRQWFGDADWYAAALPAVQGHAPLYDPIMLEPHVAVRPVHFNLPPATALLAPIAAFGHLPWGLLMASCLVIGLALVWPRLRRPWDLVLAGAVVTSIPFLSSVIFANVNSLVLLLLAIAVRWPRVAGTAIGIATAIKVAPIFAFAWLVGRRDWRGVVIGLAVAVGLTLGAAILIDPHAVVDFFIVRWNEIPFPEPLAFSLTSFGLPVVAGYLLAVVLAVIAAVRGSLLWAVLAVLASVPQLHAHYWMWLLVPIFAIGTPVLETVGVRSADDEWFGDPRLPEPSG